MATKDIENKQPCAGNQAAADLLNVVPIKREEKGLLRKTKCKKCDKVFWTNRDSHLCFDCESQR